MHMSFYFLVPSLMDSTCLPLSYSSVWSLTGGRTAEGWRRCHPEVTETGSGLPSF